MVIELKKGKKWINRMIRKIFYGASVYSITRYIYLNKGEKSFVTAIDQNFVKNSKEWINRMIREIFDWASGHSITRYIYFEKGEKSFTTARDLGFVKDCDLQMIRKRN